MLEITLGNVNVSERIEKISVTEFGFQQQKQADNGQNCQTL